MSASRYVLKAVHLAERIPDSILGFIVRVGIADVFWRSGRTKVAGWHVTAAAIQLFRAEHKVSRLSALGLLSMTAIIEIFVYPENWPDHLLWTGLLLYVIARGPGTFSVDGRIRAQYEPLFSRENN
jgi:putative oxidoreductase